MDALKKLKDYNQFIEQYNKNRKIKLKVIALRVSPQPSPEMQKVLDEVKKWTEEIKIEFLKFKDNTATN